ncbi:unnamed protein product [Rotaria sordida]|uniref:Uncharacterized protein n=1 Tax=Rotaria sordida TaxID=392033 RepID=A0A814GCP8_9BILA|nr:unnamed protein product [Rotaria sordida]CAF0992946.1 unnamed protein product [Rotaria sordida]CAF0998238.1 unnamed protein product [Rotaria sordida]
MDSIKIEWQKKSANEVHILPNRQYFKKQSIHNLDSQEIKPKKKKVRFNFRTPSGKEQAFENTENSHSRIDRTQKSSFVDYDYTSSSTRIFTSEFLETDGKKNCSTRSKIITIIILIFIILTIAIVVGVVVGVTKSQQNTSEATTIKNGTTFSVSTTTTTALVSSISIGNQSGPPCSSYTTINDPSRNVAQVSLYGPCDTGSPFNTSNGGSWIRFIGTGGTTLSLVEPTTSQCGGYSGGWINGTLPTTVGTVANATVCFRINKVSCLVIVYVSVINCGGFFVYFLPPVRICNGRYCTA